MKDARFKDLLLQLDTIRNNNPSRDPSTIQAKHLGTLQGEIMLEVIKTLTKLDESNMKLAKSNLRLQQFVAFLTVLTVVIALFK